MVFAIFNVVWATLFLEEWKRRGAEFAYKWGTLDTPAESIEEPRPQFRVSAGGQRGGSLVLGWGSPRRVASQRCAFC